jgi:hypothetical protein
VRVGILTMDPGVSTGVAWAVINTSARLAADAMRDRKQDGSTTIVGTPIEQAKLLWNYWEGFKGECVRASIPAHLVSEEFVLSPMSSASGRDATMPERVMWAFEGYRTGRHDTHRRQRHFAPLVLQRSGAASRYNSQDMLKPVGAWVKGREHERSALAHMYLYATVLVTQATANRALRRA